MDDNKVSHMDNRVNSIVSDKIEEKCEKLSRTTGKKHRFLDVDINYIGGVKVAVSTPHHVGKALEYFGETLKGKVVNPTTSQLFTITSEGKELDDLKKYRYHSITNKILWIMKRSRPYLETAVYFICPRVPCPTEEDWGKLRRVLNYLKVTKYDKSIMGSNNLLQIDTQIYT